MNDSEQTLAPRRDAAHQSIRDKLGELASAREAAQIEAAASNLIVDGKTVKSRFAEVAAAHVPPTIGQRDDGSWYWLDETFNYGDDVRYGTSEEASAAQMRYCIEVLGVDTETDGNHAG